ncbi:MAG: hypothetical protein HYW86_01710 [Candidatus Roizmanbacteria bacterium]|nr:MAG: hypothetical protein HYW86_01710 [Candidatus Roizmanbacteria bacterium]
MVEMEATSERKGLPPCKILIKGRFAPEQISVVSLPVPITFSLEETTFIDENWRKQSDKNPELFNGSLVNLKNFELKENGLLQLSVSPTDFKTHIGVRLLYLKKRG